MSTSVDVLAVMEDVGQVLCGWGCVATARKIEDSHAAVAELIEAVESYAEAEAALANRELAGINAEPHEKLQRRVHSAREELDAALTRVRGAK